ncbi:uncharacterized protein LOC110433267 [Sorghum bicolor]|nr:uncharacterized protein LOC110433267 [Sorghum bicolor]|eukprot:XP_021310696.1 uncharacterized protein LOC110433267 [Sorghum bicolor]
MPMALKVILNMAAKFPELKAKAQLPRCTCDPAYILSLGPTPTPRYTSSFSYMKQLQSRGSRRRRQPGGMSSPVVLLHLRRLDRFLKHQGLHSTAHTLERESMVYLDAAHLQKLVKGGQWEAAGTYVEGFSPLWEGEGTAQKYTSFMHNMEHHAMLAYLACRGEEGGRAASSLYCHNDDAFRKKFPEVAELHDLYRSMASAQARASVNWEDIKLKTLEELQELLHLHPDVKCSLRMRELQCTPTASEITPLGLRGSWRRRRKRVERKPACELARFLLQKKKRLPSSQQTNQPGDSGTKHSRPFDACFPEDFQQAF